MISSPVNMAETVSPHCDLDFENSKPIFSHEILAHGMMLHHHNEVWLQTVQQLRRYPDDLSLKF